MASRKIPFRSEKIGGCAGGTPKSASEPSGRDQQREADAAIVDARDRRDRPYKRKR